MFPPPGEERPRVSNWPEEEAGNGVDEWASPRGGYFVCKRLFMINGNGFCSLNANAGRLRHECCRPD